MKYNKENYIKGQQDTKKNLEDLYNSFLEKKSLSDIMRIVCNAKQIHKSYSFTNMILTSCPGLDMRIEYQGILNSFLNWKSQDVSLVEGCKGLKGLVPRLVKKEQEILNTLINQSECLLVQNEDPTKFADLIIDKIT